VSGVSRDANRQVPPLVAVAAGALFGGQVVECADDCASYGFDGLPAAPDLCAGLVMQCAVSQLEQLDPYLAALPVEGPAEGGGGFGPEPNSCLALLQHHARDGGRQSVGYESEVGGGGLGLGLVVRDDKVGPACTAQRPKKRHCRHQSVAVTAGMRQRRMMFPVTLASSPALWWWRVGVKPGMLPRRWPVAESHRSSP
jgi:hypothetical protein